ncbi:MAG: pyrophosphatase [Planctomycetes bacterium]|nr:pyrophosphatase [Planctomycetota bacterium]MCW8134429.1 pyrophosphatase [Planctomycetota bacterium]
MAKHHDHWLVRFAEIAAKSDKLKGNPDHIPLLTAGMLGECGSVIAELKKEQRDREAYPRYLSRMMEEVGDFTWYFIRLVTELAPTLLRELSTAKPASTKLVRPTQRFLLFGGAVSRLLEVLGESNHKPSKAFASQAVDVWKHLLSIARQEHIDLQAATSDNLAKTQSRWPEDRKFLPLFDEDYDPEEQLPRKLTVDFLDRTRGAHSVVVLRCNGINFGDRLTDNIEDPDGYRYHDVFHFAHAVYLGWSPVVRALLRTKRKSVPKKDEGQDGARAIILEEAVSAIVFNRAKQLNYFDGIPTVDFDLLKLVHEFVAGYEVEKVPMWQWEVAIQEGYRLFRLLRNNKGGTLTLNLKTRQLKYRPLHKPHR